MKKKTKLRNKKKPNYKKNIADVSAASVWEDNYHRYVSCSFQLTVKNVRSQLLEEIQYLVMYKNIKLLATKKMYRS